MPKAATTSSAGRRVAWRNSDAAVRRSIIVDAAMQQLSEQGVGSVSFRQLAAEIGVGVMTLYHYIESQQDLHREMIRRGFEMLGSGCEAASTLETDGSWRGGAMNYVRFAVENPNLYKLMFDVPMRTDDEDLLHGGFQGLLDRVTERMRERGVSGRKLKREARRAAGRYWIGLHGLASLAIAGRLSVLEGDLENLVDDMLPRIAPD